jgi:negative regulator of replication initiation
MKTIRISDEVWAEIAKRGKFGETEDDVLRRIFSIAGPSPPLPKPRPSGITKAILRMSTFVRSGTLFVEFENDKKNQWGLPAKGDRERIRKVRDLAVEFARQNSASFGQINAVKKALTDAGYYVSR